MMRRYDSVLALLCLLAVFRFGNSQSVVGVRFAGGVTTNYGVVEVTLSNGQVGRICDGGFDGNGASVVCAMMGYQPITGLKVSSLPAVTTGSTTSVMAVTGCPNFLATSSSTWNLDRACLPTYSPSVPAACNNRSFDVAVICIGSMTTVSPVSVSTVTPNMATLAPTNCNTSVTNLMLVSNQPDEGIVVIKSPNGTITGTICGLDFGVNEATTICRMLCQNATTNAIGMTGKYLNYSSAYPVVLSGLTCPAGASSTNECKHNGWGVASAGCTSTTAVTVRCTAITLVAPTVPRASAICQNNVALVYFPVSDVANASLLSLYGTYNASTCNFVTGQNGTNVWALMPYVGCNSVQTSNTTHVIYTSYLYKNVTLIDNVYKDSPYIIPVVCAIQKTSAVSAALLPDTRTVTPITGGDSYTSEVKLFASYSAGVFSTEITAGQKLIVGSKVYARVAVTSPLAVRLTVRNFWASDKTDGTGSRYNIVSSKCTTSDSVVFRVDSKTIGVVFTVISFTGSTSTQVYVFSDVIICSESDTDERCQQVCGTASKRRKRAVSATDIGSGGADAQPRNGPFQIVSAAYFGTSEATRSLPTLVPAAATVFTAVVHRLLTRM